MKSERGIKICLAVSAGGHATQLLKLQEVWRGMKCCSITTSVAVEKQLRCFGPVYVVPEANRQRPWTTVRVLAKCAKIIWMEKPDVLISTGAAIGFAAAFWAKLRGAKVIWVDSIANVDRLSLSGRLTKPFADLMLTQWPEVAERYESVEYVGRVV